MSLYALGKVVGKDASSLVSSLVAAANASSAGIGIGAVDGDDAEAIERLGSLRQSGVTFAIYSGPDETDAIELWNEAMAALQRLNQAKVKEGNALTDQALKCFLESRLGQICGETLKLGDAAALALIDGGIENAFEAPLNECLRQIASDICRPWDQSPNRLYVRRGEAKSIWIP